MAGAGSAGICLGGQRLSATEAVHEQWEKYSNRWEARSAGAVSPVSAAGPQQ